jgi:hypothetical protein
MTDGFVPVAKASELSPGQMKWVAVNGERRVLANVEGTFYAISDVCGHRNAPLSRGKLDGYLIECPLHYAHGGVSEWTGIDRSANLSGPYRRGHDICQAVDPQT